jgi:hypothetical protein
MRRWSRSLRQLKSYRRSKLASRAARSFQADVVHHEHANKIAERDSPGT